MPSLALDHQNSANGWEKVGKRRVVGIPERRQWEKVPIQTLLGVRHASKMRFIMPCDEFVLSGWYSHLPLVGSITKEFWLVAFWHTRSLN